MRYNNGDIYEGDWKNNWRNGKGKMTYEDGEIYEGAWKDDLMDGKGKMTYKNGDIYEGDFEYNQHHGKGKMIYEDGDIYEGEWKDDLINGKGKMTYRNGNIYEGDFEHNQQHGYGKMTYRNGNIYEGFWKDNTKNGKGKITHTNGDITEGLWKDDILITLDIHKLDRIKKSNKIGITKTEWMNLCSTNVKNITDDKWEYLLKILINQGISHKKVDEVSIKNSQNLRKICSMLSADYDLVKICDEDYDYHNGDNTALISDQSKNIKKLLSIRDESNQNLDNICKKNNISCNNEDDLLNEKISRFNPNEIYQIPSGNKNPYCLTAKDVNGFNWNENAPINKLINPYTNNPLEDTPELRKFIKLSKMYAHNEYEHIDPEIKTYKSYKEKITNANPYMNIDDFALLRVNDLKDIINKLYELYDIDIQHPDFNKSDDVLTIDNKFFDALESVGNFEAVINLVNDIITTDEEILNNLENYRKEQEYLKVLAEKSAERLELINRIRSKKNKRHLDNISDSKKVYIDKIYSTMPELDDLEMKVKYMLYTLKYTKNKDNSLILLLKLITDLKAGKYDNKNNLYGKMINISGVYLHLMIDTEIEEDDNLPLILRNLNNYFTYFIDVDPIDFTKALNNSNDFLCLNGKFRNIYEYLQGAGKVIELKSKLSKLLDNELVNICKYIQHDKKNNNIDYVAKKLLTNGNIDNIVNKLFDKVLTIQDKVDYIKEHLEVALVFEDCVDYMNFKKENK